MKKIVLLATVVLSLFVTSCQKENLESNSEFNPNILKFEKASNEDEKWCGEIVSWNEWGRASRDCGGWGLCNANWFPSCDKDLQLERLASYEKFSSKLLFDKNRNKYYFDILLAEPKPDNISNSSFSLPVDNDVFVYTKKFNLVIKKGVYEFDPSLGKFGGIRVFLS